MGISLMFSVRVVEFLNLIRKLFITDFLSFLSSKITLQKELPLLIIAGGKSLFDRTNKAEIFVAGQAKIKVRVLL